MNIQSRLAAWILKKIISYLPELPCLLITILFLCFVSLAVLEFMYLYYHSCLSLSNLFHLVKYVQFASMLQQIAGCHSFSWLNNIIFSLYIDHITFIYSPTDENLGNFHILATMNNVAINIEMQIFINIPFISFGCISASGIAYHVLDYI